MIMLRRLGFATALALTAAAAPSIPVGAATTPVSGTSCSTPLGSARRRRRLRRVSRSSSPVTSKAAGTPTSAGAWDLGPPSGLYFEVGREVFVGTVRGGPEGTFSTTYTFESQWDPDYTDRRHGDLGTVPAPDRPRQRHRRVAAVSPGSSVAPTPRPTAAGPLSRLRPPAVTT